MPQSLPLSLKPMEAQAVDELPRGEGWLFEPKHDGFRCIAFRTDDKVQLQSRNQKPLQRYFPELVQGLLDLPGNRFVMDGEIIIPGRTFEILQLRLHPAASRIEKLAADHPATLIAFDLLADPDDDLLHRKAFGERRETLESLLREAPGNPRVRLSKVTSSVATAKRWLGKPGFDGVVAKRVDLAYRPGERAMRKYKLWKTVDCVVGGMYRKPGSRLVDSLLLGLYDGEGKLHFVGRSRISEGAAEIAKALEPLVGGEGFTGRAPGGSSRWSGKERKPIPLAPVLVAEVSADHITADYMRHGARLLRWRDDKRPQDCTIDQIR